MNNYESFFCRLIKSTIIIINMTSSSTTGQIYIRLLNSNNPQNHPIVLTLLLPWLNQWMKLLLDFIFRMNTLYYDCFHQNLLEIFKFIFDRFPYSPPGQNRSTPVVFCEEHKHNVENLLKILTPTQMHAPKSLLCPGENRDSK